MNRPYFLSLKWKLVLYSSAVLLLINTIVVFLTYHSIDKTFDTYLKDIGQHQHEMMQKLIDERGNDLQYLATTLSLIRGDKGLVGNLQDFFNTNGSLLQLDWGLVGIQLYNEDLEALFFWPQINEPEEIISIVKNTLRTEASSHSIICGEKCIQYASVPVFIDGSQTGALVISATLSDTVLAFGKGSLDQTVILSTKNNTYPQIWGRGISLSTNPDISLKLLQEAARQWSFSDIREGSVKLDINDVSYLVHEFDLGHFSHNQYANLFLIRDISKKQQLIANDKRQTLWLIFASLFVTGILLWNFLWHPVQRIRLLTDTLPYLAKHRFSRVRKMITHSAPRFSDEFDILDESVIDLSKELENLQSNVESQTQDLITERDFTQSLLDTAPAIIMTQDDRGHIALLNRLGVETLGHASVGKTFLSILDQFPNDIESRLQQITRTDNDYFEHPGSVVNTNGIRRSFTWLHRRINDNGKIKILTVGVDTTERDDSAQQLLWLADHDPLTGLYNRRRFQADLEHALQNAIRYKHHGALLYFDLDQFKLVNDTSGHQAGDILLRSVAKKLNQRRRTTDIIGRMGGDEFAWLCPQMTKEQAVHLAEQISDELSEIVTPLRGYSHRLSASIGIALFPDHGQTVLDLLSNADIAMYEAKDRQRGSWHLFTGSQTVKDQMDKQIAWKSRIEDAIKNDRLELYFQPILNIATNEVTHHEALLRLVDENGEVHSPNEFIPIAEHNGLIQMIDQYVLQRAVDILKQCGVKKKYPRISVNLSGKAMGNQELPKMVGDLLKANGVNPKQFIFEITETAAVSDVLSANELITSIRELGCEFALDDFGVGFSSFYYLKELSTDYVKIDGAFIRNLATSAENVLFVKAIIEVSTGLGKKIIAEYVQDEKTLSILKDLGAHYAQGFYIGRPVNLLEMQSETYLDGIRPA